MFFVDFVRVHAVQLGKKHLHPLQLPAIFFDAFGFDAFGSIAQQEQFNGFRDGSPPTVLRQQMAVYFIVLLLLED